MLFQTSSPTSHPPMKNMNKKKSVLMVKGCGEVEYAYFSPLVFSINGGLGREASSVERLPVSLNVSLPC